MNATRFLRMKPSTTWKISSVARLVFFICACWGVRPSFATEQEHPLRVLSFNVWGIPIVADDWFTRAPLLADQIGQLQPDIVVLQEVWRREDAEMLKAGLLRFGLSAQHDFNEQENVGSGLLLASRYPIRSVQLFTFDAGKYPHTPWHIDWAAEKGFFVAEIETPAGNIDFVGTHFQATYGSADYVAVQTLQSWQLVNHVQRIQSRNAKPLVIAGDFNAHTKEIPIRTLTEHLGLLGVREQQGIDAIYYRGSKQLDLNVKDSMAVFTTPIQLPDGRFVALSDHHGVLTEFRLAPTKTSALEHGLHRSDVAIDTHQWVKAAMLHREKSISRDSLLGFAFLCCGVWLRIRSRTRSFQSWVAHFVVPLVIVSAGLWFVYLGIGFGLRDHAELHRLSNIVHRQLSPITKAGDFEKTVANLRPPTTPVQ